MTRQSIRGRFRAITPGIAAIAAAVLVAAGWIAFSPSAGATGPEQAGPRAGDTCTQISQNDRVVERTTRVDRVINTIERTTRYRCIDSRYEEETRTYTYTTRVRWTETAAAI